MQVRRVFIVLSLFLAVLCMPIHGEGRQGDFSVDAQGAAAQTNAGESLAVVPGAPQEAERPPPIRVDPLDDIPQGRIRTNESYSESARRPESAVCGCGECPTVEFRSKPWADPPVRDREVPPEHFREPPWFDARSHRPGTVPPAVRRDGVYWVQVGAYREPENAGWARDVLQGGRHPVRMVRSKINGEDLYRVQVGPYDTLRSAQLAVLAVRRESRQFADCFIVD